MTATMTTGLERFGSLTLAELNDRAARLTRVDRKYVLDARGAADLMERLPEGSLALEIDGLRTFGYDSVYLDTPRLDAFRATVTRRRHRFKVRTRRYTDSDLTFLEVKTRRGSFTVKERIGHASMTDLGAGESFVAEALERAGVRVDVAQLAPTLTVSYRRSTLVLPGSVDRLTIDTDLGWRTPDGRTRRPAPGTAVVETKAGAHASRADRVLWALGHRPQPISKYATGLAALREDLPGNRWHRLLTAGVLADR